MVGGDDQENDNGEDLILSVGEGDAVQVGKGVAKEVDGRKVPLVALIVAEDDAKHGEEVDDVGGDDEDDVVVGKSDKALETLVDSITQRTGLVDFNRLDLEGFKNEPLLFLIHLQRRVRKWAGF